MGSSGASAGRGAAPWLRRGGRALAASALVHAAAAAAVGGVVSPLGSRASSASPAPTVEVDIAAPPAEAPAAAAANAPASAALSNPRVPRVRAHRVPRLAAAPASAATPISAPADDEEKPRFALSAGTVATGPGLFEAPAHAPANAPSGGAGAALGVGDAPLGEHDVDVAAHLVSSTPPVYPPAARDAEVEADLPLEIVVGVDGRVTSARALAHAGFGLEDAAVRALHGYRFSPAMRAGRAVTVRMRWVVQFRLQ